MTCSVRQCFSIHRAVPILCALLAMVCAVPSNALGAAPHRGAQSVLPPQPSAQNPQESIALEPGKPLERELAGGQKRSFHFPLAQKQYVTLLVNCHGMTANVSPRDSAGTVMQLYDFDSGVAQITIALVAEQAGSFGLDILSTVPKAPAGICSVQLTDPRPATDKELWLHQAHVLEYNTNLLINAEKFDEALESAKKALALREQSVGEDGPEIANSLNTLGQISFLKSEYLNAESFFLRAVKTEEKYFGTDSPKVFRFVANLGGVYTVLGDLDKAAEYLQRAADIREKSAGANDALLAVVISNLGKVYADKADYNKAQAAYERSLAINQKLLGPDAPDVGDAFEHLASLYYDRGDYLRAGELHQRALTIYEKSLEPDNSAFGYPLLGLGTTYYKLGELAKAEAFCRRAFAIFEKVLGDEDPIVANSLDLLASIYHDQHDFAKAEPLYQRSLAIRKKKLGEDHADVASSTENLGILSFNRHDFARAELLYQQALAIREKAVGPEHPEFVSSLTNFSNLYMAKGDYKQSEAFLSRAIAVSERNADINLQVGSERQKLAYLDLLAAQLHAAITLNVNFAPGQAAARDLAVTTVLQRKGRVLDALSDSLEALRRRMNPEDAALLERFNNVTAEISRLVLSSPPNAPPEQHQQRIESLKEEREQLEAEISRRSAQFRAASKPVTLEAVRAALPANSALLEFAAYKRFLPEGITEKECFGESRYVVYVIRPSEDVQWKELGETRALDDLILKFRQALRDPSRSDVKDIARLVDKKIMQPLLASIGTVDRLFVSPDGELNLIPFEALVDDQDRYLAELYSITYLTSGRDLLRMQIARENKSASLVVADPFFGEPAAVQSLPRAPHARKSPSPATVRRGVTIGEDLSSLYFAPLGGTAQEGRAITSLFPGAQMLTGRLATKSAVKQTAAPLLLHIATHGFFLLDARTDATPALPQTSSRTTRAIRGTIRSENPLLRSGLALAGANLSKNPDDDGILTALEASSLDLWGTKLVTLSGCDTGVGEVKLGEGVYGLRRAFFLAGTESLVMSLWPVSDYVTRELMTEYYSGLKRGLGRGEALRQARLAMLKRKGRRHPFYWASFIQSGEWANLDGKR
jgi:CHAT domain-containing protein/Tfp pilus assembly protein PilF